MIYSKVSSYLCLKINYVQNIQEVAWCRILTACKKNVYLIDNLTFYEKINSAKKSLLFLDNIISIIKF